MPNLLQSFCMYFLAFLQFFLVALIAALVLFQRSEDSISDFASSRPGTTSISSVSPLCKITWFCFFAFLINSVLGLMFSQLLLGLINWLRSLRML